MPDSLTVPNEDEDNGELTWLSTLQQSSSSIRTVFWCPSLTAMYKWPSIQLEQPEYSKNDYNTAHKLCDKDDNYTFSMCISRNENYSHWVHKFFEHVQNFHADLPKLHAREEQCSNWLSLSLPEWTRMTRNDPPNKPERSIRDHSAVHSAQ